MTGILIVTGGSRGIGAACARLGAEQGFDVCVNYLDSPDRAAGVVREIEAMGRRAIAVKADMASEGDVVRMFETVDRELGPLTALINNAGRAVKYGPTSRVTAAGLSALWATNITGPFIACREAVRRMSTRNGGKGGAICNISSVAATAYGAGLLVDYAASKAALDVLTLGLAQEVADQGIRITGVRPGLIDTEIHVRSGNPNRVAEVAPTLPLKRAGTPEEVAAVVLFLLSAPASYVTKTIIDVAGGR